MILPGGRPLKYCFCNLRNELTGEQVFDLLSYHPGIGRYIPVNEIVNKNMRVSALRSTSGEMPVSSAPITRARGVV